MLDRSQHRSGRAIREPKSPEGARAAPGPTAKMRHFFISEETGLELSTIYAKGIYERHKMVYNLDPSRALEHRGKRLPVLLLLLGCRGLIIPPSVRTSVNQGLRRPLLLQSPTTLRFPWRLHRRGASSGIGKSLIWRASYAPGKATPPSALLALMTFSRHIR
jgi:hypothetical protein